MGSWLNHTGQNNHPTCLDLLCLRVSSVIMKLISLSSLIFEALSPLHPKQCQDKGSYSCACSVYGEETPAGLRAALTADPAWPADTSQAPAPQLQLQQGLVADSSVVWKGKPLNNRCRRGNRKDSCWLTEDSLYLGLLSYIVLHQKRKISKAKEKKNTTLFCAHKFWF